MVLGPPAPNRANGPGPKKRVFLGSVLGGFWPVFGLFFRVPGLRPETREPAPWAWPAFAGPTGPYLGSFSAPSGRPRRFWLSQGLAFPGFSRFLALLGSFRPSFWASGPAWPVLGFTARSFWGPWPPFRPFYRAPPGPGKCGRPVACFRALGPKYTTFGPF